MYTRNQEGKAQYWCSTTSQWYEPVSTQTTSLGVWCACPMCDSSGNTGDYYNVSQPQWHLYPTEDAPEVTDEVRQITALVTALEWTPV